MATERFIASFNKTGVEAEVFSEANSVTYKIQVGGGTNHSPNGYLKRNDDDITGLYANGLNIRSFNSIKDSPEIKSFELTTTSSAMNTSFMTYINTSPHKLIVIFSGKNLRSSPEIDAWFAAARSVAWPGSYMCNNFSCGYVAFYSPARKKIIGEVAIYSDGNEKKVAEYVAIADEVDDIGALGFPGRITYDLDTYETDSSYEYKRFPSAASVNRMADYGLAPGAAVLLSADLIQAQSMLNAGMKTRINLRWYKGTTLLDSSVVLEVPGIEWHSAGSYSKAPADADGFTIVVSRFPRNDAVIGRSAVKNVVFTEVSRDGTKNNNGAAMGVNGIRAGGFVEQQTDNHLMDLGLFTSALTNIVNIVGIKEGDSSKP